MPIYKKSEILGLEFIDKGERLIIPTPTMSSSDLTEAGHIAELVRVFFNNRTARSAILWY